jgi:hypothetical protein
MVDEETFSLSDGSHGARNPSWDSLGRALSMCVAHPFAVHLGGVKRKAS